MRLTNHYPASSISGFLDGNLLVNNLRDSSVGVGWSIEGLDRLDVQPNGDVLLITGDGGMRLFKDPMDGSALKFRQGGTTTGDYVIPNGVPHLVTHTVEAWIRPASTLFGFFFAQPQAFRNSCTNGILFSASGDQICYDLNRNDTSGCAANAQQLCASVSTLGQWIHVSGSWDATTQISRLFINGIEVGSRSSVGWWQTSGGQFTIIGAMRFFTYRNFFDGDIDEMRLWNIARSETEIQSTMNKTLTGNEVGLVAYWNFNEGLGQLAFDSSSNNHTGFLGGSATAQAVDPEWISSTVSVNCPSGGDCELITPDADFSKLVRHNDGTFTRTMKNGTKISFDINGLMTQSEDRNGLITQYGYDVNQRLDSIIDPVNIETTLTYVGDYLESIIVPDGRTTYFTHDSNGHLIEIEDPDFTKRKFYYDARGLMLNKINKRDFLTTYDYDFAGRIKQGNWSDGSTRKLASASIVALTDSSTGFGTAGNPSSIVRKGEVFGVYTDGNNHKIYYQMDKFGAMIYRRDELNQITQIERDNNSSPTKTIRPNLSIVNIVNDTRGNVLKSTDENINAITTYTYESNFNQVKTIQEPEGGLTTFNYDVNGNLDNIVDDDGTITKMEYLDTNCLGQVTSIISAFGLLEETTISFSYDVSTCNVISSTCYHPQYHRNDSRIKHV